MVRQARQETQHPTHKANRSPDAGNHRTLISHIPHRTHSFFVLLVTRVTSSAAGYRSEEHTSELQSQSNLVCRLLLEKKKNKNIIPHNINILRARLQRDF